MSTLSHDYKNTKRQRRSQRGFSVVELLIAMVILTVGLLGGMIIIVVASANNAKARMDTSAVALAQSTMDRILVISQSAGDLTTQVTDCTGTSHSMNTAPGGAPLTNLPGSMGSNAIDFSAAPVAGYQMLYTLCATGASGSTGAPQTYDVRWRVDNVSSLNPASNNQVISVAAKNVGTNGNGLQQAQFFTFPVTLRGLRGN